MHDVGRELADDMRQRVYFGRYRRARRSLRAPLEVSGACSPHLLVQPTGERAGDADTTVPVALTGDEVCNASGDPFGRRLTDVKH